MRLEAGLCLYGHEINESITPVEAGLQWLLKEGANQFPGADKILSQLKYGADKIRVGVHIHSKIPVREGSVICTCTGAAVGYVTSGGFSPNLERPVAMAIVEPYALELEDTFYIKVRKHHIAVTVTSLPFIPHRYHR